MNRMFMGAMLLAGYFFSLSVSAWASQSTPASAPNNYDQTNTVGPANAFYQQGITATNNNDFQKAYTYFQQALSVEPNNPDILNMLAHSQRKLGMIDESLANYKRALELRPAFPEAHEYLAEAYIDAASHEANILAGAGSQGKEQLDILSKYFKDAAGKI